MTQFLKLLKNNTVLIVICLLFLGTRLFRIDSIPGSVYWDEASIGYNAYSVLQTGKDEWGETLPLHFRAFGEFKLPVYIYSVVIAEMFFGMSALAVRLPAVIYGLFSVLGMYLVVLALTKNKTISLLSSFLFTVSPWFFIFSRTGYEAIAGICFFIWGIYLFLRFKNNSLWVLSSVLSFLLSAYSYNSFRILAPIVLAYILLNLFINYPRAHARGILTRSRIKKKILPLILSILILIASAIPIYRLYKQDAGLSRLASVGSKDYISNYLKNFSPEFLFSNGDSNPRSQLPRNGQLYYPDALFVLLGIFYIYQKKDPKYLYFLVLLILAPIPSAITKENPHALRSILLSPVFAVISAMGMYYLSEVFKKQKKYVLTAAVILYALSFEGYFYKFGNNYNDLTSDAWQYPYKELIVKHKDNFDKYNRVYIWDKYAQPYIFVLFYDKIEPKKFIETKTLNNVSDWGFSTVLSFDKFVFIKGCEADFEIGSLVLCP